MGEHEEAAESDLKNGPPGEQPTEELGAHFVGPGTGASRLTVIVRVLSAPAPATGAPVESRSDS